MTVLVREISLPCGKVALVSESDWPRVRDLSWSDRGGGYVRARWKKSAGGDGRFVYLHRFIMSAPDGLVVDHIDNNPLNNTRENLQLASQSRNAMRSPKTLGGVTAITNRRRTRWRARMRVDGRMVSLGCYDSPEEAQQMIDAARKIVWTDPDFNALGVKL